jgi:hypothetical protein
MTNLRFAFPLLLLALGLQGGRGSPGNDAVPPEMALISGFWFTKGS